MWQDLEPYVDSIRKHNISVSTNHYTVMLDNSYTELGWDKETFDDNLIKYCDRGGANFGGSVQELRNDGYATTFSVEVYVD